MIDISFLTPPSQLKRLSGLEYIDYQGKAFYNALTTFVSKLHDSETDELNWNKQNREALSELIKQYTNLRIVITPVDADNFGITANFISPGNVLNPKYVIENFSPDRSQIGDFFKEFKRKSLVGWCDLKTGKVEGDFKNVRFDLFVPEKMFISYDVLKRVSRDVSISELIAGAILHESGHAFFGLHAIASKTTEDIFFTRTLMEINNEKDVNKKLKVAILFKKETDIDITDAVKKTGKVTIIDFEKGMADRDHIRTLSLGASKVTSEILANAYAIRMGASLAIGAIFGSYSKMEHDTVLLRLGRLVTYTTLASMGFTYLFIFPLFAAGNGIGLAFGLGNQLLNGSHETSYRTIKSALRDIIDLIRKNKDKGDKSVVAELMKEAILLDKMADDAKPILESTSIQRLYSSVFYGIDAKKADVEMYTSELNYNPLSLYTDFTQ